MHALAITAAAAVTPLANDLDATFARLLRGDRAAGRCELPSAADVPRCLQLGLSATRQLAIDATHLRHPHAGLFVGTSKGEIDVWIRDQHVTPEGLASVAAGIRCEMGMAGPCRTVSAACSSGLQALVMAALAIEAGECSEALVVAVESSLHPIFAQNFRRLGVYSDSVAGCRPFARQRSGFALSEAAAAVWLASTPAPAANTLRLCRWALAGDPTHITGIHPQGDPLRTAVRRCLGSDACRMVHAHGTGTRANDAAEIAALEAALPKAAAPPVYSHKGALGHTLGASGLLSVALTLKMKQSGRVPAQPWLADPMPTRLGLSPSEATFAAPALVISLGFGGPIAAVLLE